MTRTTTPPPSSATTSTAWPLERVLFAMAGTVTMLGALLAAVVSPWFLLLVAFVAASQWMYVATGSCPASIVLEKAFGLERGCRR
jgi:hypothetical protein